MNRYKITSDSTVDLGKERMEELGIPYVQLFYIRDNVPKRDGMTDQCALEIYDNMRNGVVYKSSQANPEDFTALWTPILEGGQDILYIGFSTGLSGVVNSAFIARGELGPRYPDRKIFIVDSLCASGGEGLFLEKVVEKQNSGATIEECRDYAEALKLRVNHWYTVSELAYLRRGGRVAATSAIVADILNIKPVMDMNDQGKLIPREKAKGRKAAIRRMFEHLCERADIKENAYFRITHADCMDDALSLKQMLQEKFNGIPVYISMVGAVIGSHCGPGTLALFFIGKPRGE
jgi:DegV family protein with EDD domain